MNVGLISFCSGWIGDTQAFLPQAALKKSANTSSVRHDFDWNYINPPPTWCCAVVSQNTGKSRPDKVQCDLLRQCSQNLPLERQTIIGLVLVLSFRIIYFFLGLVCFEIFHELNLILFFFTLTILIRDRSLFLLEGGGR